MADTTLTWLGHAAFRLDTASGKRIYVDPFLNGNPKCPESEQTPERADIIAVTHGHGDHVGDTVALAKKHGAAVVALVELARLAREAGRRREQAAGAEQRRNGRRRRRQVHADERVPLGLGTGRLLRRRAVGHRRQDRGRQDALLRRRHVRVRRHAADRAHLRARRRDPPDRRPLHDGPEEAAVAVELLGVKRVVPCHWGTFGLLTGTPDELQQLAPSGVHDRAARAGRVGDGVRERWFGATGRRVPELAVDGELDLDDALVLDDARRLERLRAAFDAGTPVVVRAASRRGDQGGARAAGGRVRRSCPPTGPSCSSSTSPS